MTYPIMPIGPLGIVALFLLGFATRGILAVLCERKRAAEGQRIISDSGWKRGIRGNRAVWQRRIIRDGNVNPKPAGEPPPVPVQTPKVQR